MSDRSLQLYTIVSLDVGHIDEICADICRQYRDGIATCALFCMTLVPEGNPPADKVTSLCERYVLFRDRLAAEGVPSGVLVQASIGHGWVLSEMFPFQQVINFNNGDGKTVVCPYDEGFRGYIRQVMTTIASCHPDHIMVDDDFRLIFREGQGCGCPLHMKRFNELAGTDLTREELWNIVSGDDERRERYAKLMAYTQSESLLETAKAMREGIDAVDPRLPASFCCVGPNAENGAEIAAILAGEGNPSVVRINNGNYTPAGARLFSRVFARAAQQVAKLKGKVDVILAETDTCPQNRYSTSAMSLHTHFTGTILEGTQGAKHWITRLSAHEPESGKAYRRVLGKHRGFYEALAKLEPTLRWRGCRIPVTAEAVYDFREFPFHDGWSLCVLERMGIPMYFSAEQGGVACLEGAVDSWMTDEEILKMLSGPVFLASDTAARLIARGFGEYLGVDVRPWTGKTPTTEQLYVNGNNTNVQQEVRELIPATSETEVDSMVLHSVDKVHYEPLFPGTTIYRNSLGGTVFAFSGTPRADYNIIEAFSFLTWSRKQQLLRMLQKTDELPVFFPGDEEVYLRAADMEDGGLFCAVFNLGLDPIEQLELTFRTVPARIERLCPDGSREPVAFAVEDGVCRLNVPAWTLDPVVLFTYEREVKG